MTTVQIPTDLCLQCGKPVTLRYAWNKCPGCGYSQRSPEAKRQPRTRP
jgi:hypothetical protein